jgi:hypothetical protein
MNYNEHSQWRLVLRSLLPSASSLVGGFVLGLGVIGFHLLLLSQQAELFLPHVTGAVDDRVAQIYTTSVLGPLDQTFGSSTFGLLSTAFVWGLVGWIIYALLDYAVTSLKEWRTSKTDISVQGKNEIVRHPMQHQFVIRNLWRFLLSVLLVVYTVGLQPVIANLLARDISSLRANTATEMLAHIGIALLGWTVIFQVYVILFRFFVFRTRVFGEILY